MTRTPDEIKKGLEHCINGTSCRGCPYCEECAIASDCNPMHKDLQEYIQQLESDKQQLEGMLAHMNQLRDAAARRALQMEERVHQLEAERDAAINDIMHTCATCKHYFFNKDDGSDCEYDCLDGPDGCHNGNTRWEWCGVQKEDSDA